MLKQRLAGSKKQQEKDRPAAAGCAILWGRPFRRGVVAAESLSWTQLRATLLDALGAAGEYQEASVVKQLLRPPENAEGVQEG